MCPWATHRVSVSRRAGPGNHPVGPPPDVGRPLTLGYAVVPQCPAGMALADFGRRQAFVRAVVPFHEIRVGFSDEAGQRARLRGPDQGAGEHLAERRRPELSHQDAGGPRLLATLGEEGNIRAAGVFSILGPLRGSVTKEHHPAGHGP